MSKYDNLKKIQDGFSGAWKTNALYSCIKWHRKRQHGYSRYRKTVSLVVADAC